MWKIFQTRLILMIALLLQHCSSADAEDSDRTGVKWGVLPVGQYSTDQGLTLGVLGRRFDYDVPGFLPYDNLSTVQATYSTQGPANLFMSFDKTRIGSENLRLHSALTVSTNPFQHYYGFGDQTPVNTSLQSVNYYNYNRNYFSFENTLRKKFDSRIEIKTGLMFMSSQVAPSQQSSQYAVDFGSAPISLFYTTVQVGVLTDQRNLEFVPSRGYYGSALLNFSPAFLGTASTWARLDLDYRHYFSLIQDRWLWLAFQFFWSTSTASAPLTEKAMLGGQGTLRGLTSGRYLSNLSTTQRVDLRSVLVRMSLWNQPIKGGVGLFMDTGHIGDSFSRLFQTPTHWGYGGSLFASIFTDDFLCNGDLGVSIEGTYIYAGLGYAF